MAESLTRPLPDSPLPDTFGERPDGSRGSDGLGLPGISPTDDPTDPAALGEGKIIGKTSQIPIVRSRPERSHLVTEGKPTIRGALDKEIIRRVIRRSALKFLSCYEDELKKDPALEGKVILSFVIDKDGTIAAHRISKTFSNEVGECIDKMLAPLAFPAPEGGSVEVTYPLIFTKSTPPFSTLAP